ncbi:putative GNAT-like acetyltransferase [Hamiltosporidium tvaerminnensis]|uniref:N-alpha-acetyltransferase 40 n=1 Tax=Hamiltosporidium tvaerminnensis TaxID=1176355 RepID=A0A4Q9M3L5_9MICR|nr:putative GNAT-like acetyltransferase [Hamiltosporidium tvaerminnensis]TBU20181.1 putative GNAT-like acetyltransferase [Hamiltosporidium tvaerminnensis]
MNNNYKIIKENKNTRDIKKWALNLTIENMKQYNSTSLYKYTKNKSISNKKSEFIICYFLNKKVGFCMIRKENRLIFIYEIHVTFEHRSKGVGTLLLDFCKKYYLNQKKYENLVLFVLKNNYKAISFYEKNNFLIDKSYDDSILHYCYKFNLNNKF